MAKTYRIEILGYYDTICTCSMAMAKAGGLRRPTAQKRLDSGAIGRKTWFTVLLRILSTEGSNETYMYYLT